ncbi:MAG: serine protease [Clostridia bacterium]|nr:serine protease [Clostridia bacterium]
MKKFLYILSCFMVIVFAGVFLAGCNLNGKSAYDIAVEHGFKGTEAEWLASLKGEDGQDASESAYDIAVKNGFEGTEEEWLASLKGEPGDDGYNGQDGDDGEDGSDLTVNDLFLKAVEFGLYTNDAEGYSKFLSDYFSTSVDVDIEDVANKCLNQAVSIYCRDNAGALSAGAGVFYSIDKTNNEAYIITNYHVVSCYDKTEKVYYVSNEIRVYLYGQESIWSSGTYVDYGSNAIVAEYIGGSANYDLAVLKVTGEDFEKIRNSSAKEVIFANTDNLKLGQTAVAIGNPGGDGTAVSSGVISTDSEEIVLSIAGSSRQLRVLRMDTPVNPGNSGGGLFNGNCELIGIVNAKKSDYIDTDDDLVTYDNIAYALPANYVKNVVENVIYFYNLKYQEDAEDNSVGVHKYLIGLTITIENPRNEYIEATNTHYLSEDTVVVEVTEGGTAQNIGFMAGDKIKSVKVTSIDETETTYEIKRRHHLIDGMLSLRLGDRVVYTVIRTDAETGEESEVNLVEFTVTLGGYAEYKNADA